MEQFDIIPHINCETGTLRDLLRLNGYVNYSEAMIFGVGEGLIFSFSKWKIFKKIGFIACRRWQGTIMCNFLKKAKIPFAYKRYFPFMKEKSMKDLDNLLLEGTCVGVLTSVGHLPFLKDYQRFFFNGHSIFVFGKQGQNYQLIDNFDPGNIIKQIGRDDLLKARFNLNIPIISGHCYYIKGKVDVSVDWRKLVLESIGKTCRRMLESPFSFIGIKGIRTFAEYIRKYKYKTLKDRDFEYFIYIYRMLEVGSGGSGYRYLYADFLHEVALAYGYQEVEKAAVDMRVSADMWRMVSVKVGRIGTRKVKSLDEEIENISSCLMQIADIENNVFEQLYKNVKCLLSY